MYLSKSIRCMSLIAPIAITCIATSINANIPITQLRGLSTCMNPAYLHISPALGALFTPYVHTLTRIGYRTSEAVMLLQQLFVIQPSTLAVAITDNPTSIGCYIDPADIGIIIALVMQYQNGFLNDKEISHKIKLLLKKIITRNQYTIKKAIIEKLEATIQQDNEQYCELEKSLVQLHAKQDSEEIKKALYTAATSWNVDTENVVLNKLTHQPEKILFAKLKKLHKKLTQNRTFLDEEQRADTISHPLLKDSMSAFSHALIGAISEEGKIYIDNNTINILLTFLWHKATSIDCIRTALQAVAQTLSIAPEKLSIWKAQEPYTAKDYELLKAKNESDIAHLPLEDIVFVIAPDNPYISSTGPLSDEGRMHYFQNFAHQAQNVKDLKQKALFNSLATLFAPTWHDINRMDPILVYCRFLMQPTDTLAQQIKLMQELCQEKINTTDMLEYYLEAITNMYQSLPKDFQTQFMFFDCLINVITHDQSTTESAAQLHNRIVKLILDAKNDAVKTAILVALMKNQFVDITPAKGFETFDTAKYILDTIKTIHTDPLKTELIKFILALGTMQHDWQQHIVDALAEWAMKTLPTITDEEAQIGILKGIMTNNNIPANSPSFSWANKALAELNNDAKKADLIIDTFGKCASRTFPTAKEHTKLLSILVNKTLPSVHQESAVIKIITSLLTLPPSDNEAYKEQLRTSYDWLKEKITTMSDVNKKAELSNIFINKIDPLQNREYKPGNLKRHRQRSRGSRRASRA